MFLHLKLFQVTSQSFEDVKMQLASSIQQYAILQEQLRRLEHDHKRVKDLLESEKMNSALIAGQNQKLSKDIQTADSEVSQYREQRDTLMSEITSHRTTILTYDGRFAEMQRQINMLHGALQAERKDNDEMRKLLQDSREQNIKIENPSFSQVGEVDNSKGREAIRSLHVRLADKEDECLNLKKLLQALKSGTETQSSSLHADAALNSSSLHLEISETKKVIASVQAENEVLRLQLQSAQAQLRQKEQILGYNSSSTLYVDMAHIHSNGSTGKTALVSSHESKPSDVISEKPASSSRPSSGSISDGISEIGSFFGSFASRVQSTVVQAASSVSTTASSVTSAASSFTAQASSNASTHVVNSSNAHESYSSVAVESVSISKKTVQTSATHFSEVVSPSAITKVPGQSTQLQLSQAAADSNATTVAPSVVGTGLFITSSKTQDTPVRYSRHWHLSRDSPCSCHICRYQHVIQSILKGSPASFVESIQPNDILVNISDLLLPCHPSHAAAAAS